MRTIKKSLLLKCVPRLIPEFLSQLFAHYSNMTFMLNIDVWDPIENFERKLNICQTWVKTQGRQIGRSILRKKKAFPFANVRHRYFAARFFRAELFRNLCACRHKVRNELHPDGEKEREKEEGRGDIIKLAAKLVLERGGGSAGRSGSFLIVIPSGARLYLVNRFFFFLRTL